MTVIEKNVDGWNGGTLVKLSKRLRFVTKDGRRRSATYAIKTPHWLYPVNVKGQPHDTQPKRAA